jgi:hypothetical protein
MVPTVPAALASRFLEPLSRPWAFVAGGAFSVGAMHDEMAVTVLRVAWRLLRLLLAL